VGDALEASVERLRDHLRRPYRPQQRKLAITAAIYTVLRTLPRTQARFTLGARVHLAHPLGVTMFGLRRVKNDERHAADLADLLRMGLLPEAWIAPPATRELRGWVRQRAKLVGARSGDEGPGACAARGHRRRSGADECLFGPGGQRLLAASPLAVESRARVDSLLRLIWMLDFEIDTFARLSPGGGAAIPEMWRCRICGGPGPPGGRRSWPRVVRRRDR
jgi:hypothetical protein